VLLVAALPPACSARRLELQPARRWQPKFDKIDPCRPGARMFSAEQLVRTLKACLLALVLGAIGAWSCGSSCRASPTP
jgi:flagellar biosynthesis protein FlhB